MEIALLLAALAFGFLARLVKLPPLVGYLVAGFVLYGFGYSSTEGLEFIADVGVLLLLFGVGLKLNVATLLRPPVWASATAFTVGATVVYSGLLLLLGVAGLPLATELDVQGAVVTGFALSFASTVFAVQALERTNEASSLAGRLAVGVLVLQDLFAVGFLVFTGDEVPTVWALLIVPGFFVVRWVSGWILDRSDHGEILVLLGFTLAVAIGAGTFEAVGLKPDLGALVAGIAVGGHRRAGELADTLLGFKDLFLVGFFLSIGLAGVPPLGGWIVAAILLVLVPLRAMSFIGLFTRFRLRSRTALQAGLTLSTYSEFGLIVGSAALAAGYISQDWVATVAVAVAASFIVGSWANAARYRLYGRWGGVLSRIERRPIVREDAVVDCGWARVLIFGMGRIGAGAYDEMIVRRGGGIVGVDRNPDVVADHRSHGRSVIRGDALDLEFWERFQFHPEVQLVFVAMNSHAANLVCVRRVREFLPNAQIAAIARYADDVEELRAEGVNVARNLYEEAGQALADDAVSEVYGARDGGA